MSLMKERAEGYVQWLMANWKEFFIGEYLSKEEAKAQNKVRTRNIHIKILVNAMKGAGLVAPSTSYRDVRLDKHTAEARRRLEEINAK